MTTDVGLQFDAALCDMLPDPHSQQVVFHGPETGEWLQCHESLLVGVEP
jgi:hypothetical protein